VTRGKAKLLGIPDGIKRLVDAYPDAGGPSVTPADVIVHELLLVLRWFGQAVQNEREGIHEGYPPAYFRQQIRSVLRRAESL